MQRSKERVLGTINQIIDRTRSDLEQLAARVGEPSADVQLGARIASSCLKAMEALTDRIPLRDFLDRLDEIDQLGRSAHDVAAGRTLSNEEVMRRARRTIERAHKRASKKRNAKSANGRRRCK